MPRHNVSHRLRPGVDWPRVNWDSPQAAGLRFAYLALPDLRLRLRELARGNQADNAAVAAVSLFFGADDWPVPDLNGSTHRYESSRNSGYSGDVRMSITAWINPDTVSTTRNVVYVGDSATTLAAAGLAVGSGGSGTLAARFDASTNGYTTATGVVAASAWQHIALTKAPGAINTTTKLYLNGVEVASASASANTPNVTDAIVRIGSNSGGTNRFDGKLNDVRFYDRVLPPALVWQMYDPATRWQLYRPLRRRTWFLAPPAPLVRRRLRLDYPDRLDLRLDYPNRLELRLAYENVVPLALDVPE